MTCTLVIGVRDNFVFGDREARFGKFLDMVEACPNAKLVLLGDLLDLLAGAGWVGNRGPSAALGPPRGNGGEVVVGNHDNALAALIGTPLMIDHPLFQTCCGPFVEEIAGRKFLFMHGHEGDPYCCDPNPGTGEITAIISGMLEDRNKGPFPWPRG